MARIGGNLAGVSSRGVICLAQIAGFKHNWNTIWRGARDHSGVLWALLNIPRMVIVLKERNEQPDVKET
jgi:hypothetical protein